MYLEEYNRNAAMSDAGHFTWNTSQHDPWWRNWLTSAELYATIEERLPAVAIHRQHLLGGNIYSYDSGYACQVDAWVSPDGIVVAYPVFCNTERSEACDIDFFEEWIGHLYHSEALPLGQIRFAEKDVKLTSSNYGAIRPRQPNSALRVMWAQAGDWAALFRNWRNRGLDDLASPT